MARIGAAAAVVAVGVVVWGILASQRANAELKKNPLRRRRSSPSRLPSPVARGEEIDLSLPGNVQANTDAPIYARTSGYLKRWLVDIGTR